MEKYIKGPLLGKGTFGEVIKATHKETGEVVAIKRIRVSEKGEGVNVTALREVRLLREMRHEHVLHLREVLPAKRGLSLVFDFMETDLEKVIRDRSLLLSPPDVKAYMAMILAALAACHAAWILHRDVKPDNFLVASDGRLVLADFGLARVYGSPTRPFTHQVFARWYRAPELLYGSSAYGPAVDVWAAGCVFAELMLRRPWFPADSDVEVLAKIYAALGTPPAGSASGGGNWAGLDAMPAFVEFQPTPAPGLRASFPNPVSAPDDALDLLARMVSLDPARRVSAADALKHRYFRADPAPTPRHRLPKPFNRAAERGGPGGGAVPSERAPAAPGSAAADAAPPPPPPTHLRPALTPLPLADTPAALDFVDPADARRPRLDSDDVRFLKKRRMQLDAAFEDEA